MAGPIGFGLAAMLSGNEMLGYALPAVLAVTAWIPVVNPLSQIYFIRTYRESIMRALCFPCGRRKVQPTNQTTAITGLSLMPPPSAIPCGN